MKKILLSLIAITFLSIPLIGLAVPVEEAPVIEFDTAVTRVMNLLFTVLMLVAAIFVLIAAFMFLMAGGDPEKVNKARDYILYALIGVVVAFIARGLVLFVKTVMKP